ncbi:carboxymuconolactone decarboxylase family protein [Sphaerisporangium sp. TRM90804]|uniref:carboxymuconolactone decarboxylase family protein n=1 Tax=Sphaerisporangium sp. TRM90804 TaxID=3031113 RepID=UPI00244C7FE5|nr:carboxymuconolactone decarboxylase family protein [Sphaerisporangium sp. TRM90804]MDH2426609.1 carboxymuconolactone decarboxylase family protein [Sphaerisporangium sp. TRM90804]
MTNTMTDGATAEAAGPMKPRFSLRDTAPEIYQAMRALDAAVEGSGLEPSLIELVKIRASQLNGCAYCIDMHTRDARAGGESEQRVYALTAWHETPFFTPRERAALELTEAATLLPANGVSDELYERTARHFSEGDLVKLIWAIVVINAWNRVAGAARLVPGTYVRPAG